MSLPLEELAVRLVVGDRPALARALSLAERDKFAAAGLLARLADRPGGAHVVGITGPPGAGKSTLVGVIVRQMLQKELRVAVLAVDPSSPLTGGALLGDRFRIGEAIDDQRCFVRSTATRGSLGGLTSAARQMVELMDAAGFDLILVETVGTGQSEVDVAGLVDSLLVVFPPGLGDEMQAMKAGILELADLLVVTKGDTAGAQQASQMLHSSTHLWRTAPPIHLVSSLSGEGISALTDAVLSRMGSAPSRRKQAQAALVRQDPAGEFGKLKGRLESVLPVDAVAGWSFQLLESPADCREIGLRILCAFPPGVDSFRLGTVTGALIALAAAEGLRCGVGNPDLTAGRLELLLERKA